jgi:hypothetical protein
VAVEEQQPYHKHKPIIITTTIQSQPPPRRAQAAVEEQRRIVAKHGESLSMEVLNEMDTLHLDITEALRLQPPLILVLRYAREAFAVSTKDGKQYVVPKVGWGLGWVGGVVLPADGAAPPVQARQAVRGAQGERGRALPLLAWKRQGGAGGGRQSRQRTGRRE